VLDAEMRQLIENPPSTTAERRARVRWPCNRRGACQPLAGAHGLQWVGEICNVSAGGIVLRLDRRFEIGALLAIDVQGPVASVLVSLSARVGNLSLQSDGSWILRCAFPNHLTEEEVKALQ